MKNIKILQKDSEPIELLDDDKTDLSEYCQQLSTIMKSSNVSILETSSKNVIVRPSDITAIEVTEGESKPSVKEDIITDGDV